MGTPPKAACSSTLTEFPLKLLEVEPGPFATAKEALTASTITAIRAGSWTPEQQQLGWKLLKMFVAPSLPKKRAMKEQTNRGEEHYPMATPPHPN